MQARLLADAQTGKLHPSVLTVLMTYAYGRPNLRDVPEPETPITIELNIPKPLILKVAPMPVTAEPPAAHPGRPFFVARFYRIAKPRAISIPVYT